MASVIAHFQHPILLVRELHSRTNFVYGTARRHRMNQVRQEVILAYYCSFFASLGAVTEIAALLKSHACHVIFSAAFWVVSFELCPS